MRNEKKDGFETGEYDKYSIRTFKNGKKMKEEWKESRK